ncbi:putative alanyl-tRNA editing protein alaX [Candida viswanathii]|uniref:Putative alanyl-tRNA editing protein alaX n=1 Tax=Candida viswanathii TaxID=5486 RepID=A0A367YC95_9ASCO|nr:putative alanyl-tRNA editing protein alaX [Candida viswanathii]
MTAAATSTIVGALSCQKNSFLKTFNTQVVSSYEFVPPLTSKDKQNKKSQSTKPKEFGIEFQDTILFPEGGGQPYDKGTITILPENRIIDVKSVVRDKLKAVHLVDELIEPGTEVTLNVDWARRIDIMQQHTGQHLLSAVFDTFGLETLSWSMGDEINYIELPEKINDELLGEVQERVNQLIVEGIPISVVTPDEHGHEVDVSHLPDDYDLSKGIVRIVKIGELDANPCCGTHLTSTAQIQSIALLHQAPVRGGHSRLFFTCGARVANVLRREHELLREVATNQLSCSIEAVAEKVDLLSLNARKTNSSLNSLLKELAGLEAAKIFEGFKEGKKVAYVYRADLPDYLTAVNKELLNLINGGESSIDLNNTQTLVLLNGAPPSGGTVKITGPEATAIQTELKQKLSNLKGGGKGSSFQGKITKFEKGELETVLKYLDSICT